MDFHGLSKEEEEERITDLEEEEENESKIKSVKSRHSPAEEESESESEEDNESDSEEKKEANTTAEEASAKPKKKGKKKVKPLTPEELAKWQEEQNRTGIVYISRVPPFMKPQKIRQLLSQYGEIGRVYLAPEDPKIAKRRKKYGGNKKKNFDEGWVEFKDKRIAKLVAKTLNTQPMGGSKRGFYHDDLWNIKYLPKFKWHHLTEQIAYENAARQQRLRAEIAQAKRENQAYIQNVERAKMVKSMEERDAKRKTKRKAPEEETEEKKRTNDEIRRSFKQRKIIDREAKVEKETESPIAPEMKNILSKVF
ncbi:uncharacterized protein VTP21DRAFT_4958 [Calcarisporiella thermophila]|uniref:uncharacterized protein n=1 Tax=Calcarisporiella thermophila TaxID=911321 RepID=UPI0037448659